MYINPGKSIDGTFYPAGFYHATFFYESMWNLIVFAVLILVRKKIKVRGGVFALYVTLYGFGRFWIEQMRTDSLMWGNIRVSEGLSELLFFGGIAYLVYMYFTKREYFPYSGYYNLGLTEEQIDSFKGKNALMNAQFELKKAKWYSELIHDNNITSPYYRAVREKADELSKKAETLLEELGEDDPRVQTAQNKADAANQKADKLYAKFNLNGRLKLALEDAEKAEAEYKELQDDDPDSTETLAAQEKVEAANLLVEKIRDTIAEDQKIRDELLEKEELHIEALEEKVQLIEEELSNKGIEMKESEDQEPGDKKKESEAKEPGDKKKDSKAKESDDKKKEPKAKEPDKEKTGKEEPDKKKPNNKTKGKKATTEDDKD